MTKEEFIKTFYKTKPFLDSLVYYGCNDYAGILFVRDVCENIDYLEGSINELNEKVETVDDVYRFLWIFSFRRMASEINNYKIDEELKRRILQLSGLLKTNDSSFVEFVNANYKTMFFKNYHEKIVEHEFFYYVLELCYGRYSKGIKDDVFKYFESNYALHILSHFDACSNYYSKHKDGFKKLFADIQNTRPFDDQIYLRFLINYASHKDLFLEEQAKYICERTLVNVEKMNLDSDNQVITQVQSLIQDYEKLAVIYRLKCANDYKLFTKDISKQLDAFVRKYGAHQRIGPIDLRPAIEQLKKNNDPYRFILLTHNNDEPGNFNNVLNYIFEVDNKNNPLSEVLNDISRNRSEKYPYYKQDSMRINLFVRSGIIGKIYGDNQLLKEFADYIYNVSIQVQEKYFENTIDIEKEITGEVDCFASLTEMIRQKQFDTPLGKTMVYGLTMSFCSTIEKILRNVALKQAKKDQYFDADKITLAALFGQPNLLKDLSDGLKYHLEFYLIKEVNYTKSEMERPGLNIRNKMMHGQDEAYEESNYNNALVFFYFLISLLNDLLIITLPEE